MLNYTTAGVLGESQYSPGIGPINLTFKKLFNCAIKLGL